VTMSWFLLNRNLTLLEPYDWKLSCTVLRGERGSNAPDLPGKYLSTVALQPDGKIGYVQPIGEKAIPGQVVDANSTSNFGVGAFLLAACERVRYLDK
ncbi:glycoside hydrolase family 88 protein, partial [Bacteroides acidifaciens]|uniref:glycoside hydrolase family 88 protein n=1 Tax=Bacteroides acidifaciens TaxID=85831 RepID=UPI002149F48B